jgi:hypothetical protein
MISAASNVLASHSTWYYEGAEVFIAEKNWPILRNFFPFRIPCAIGIQSPRTERKKNKTLTLEKLC